MKKLTISVLGLLALWACYSPPSVQAECRVLTSPETYTAGQVVRDVCDIHGTRLTQNVDASGNVVGSPGGTANAAAPTLSEGGLYGFFLTLAGALRATLDTLISGEDQTNNLLMTSGGAVRFTTFSSVTAASTNSAVTTVPTGPKTFVAQIINATSETKAATLTIYGNLISSTTGGIALCTITLPSTASTLQLQDSCPVTTVSFPYYFYSTASGGAGYTSASFAPLTVYAAY